jgi:hypothetical protein
VTARIIGRFLVSVATVLLLTAAAKLYSATGTARILSLADPLLHVNNRLLLIALGLVETAVAAYLLVVRGEQRQLRAAIVVLWLSSNFIAYRLGIHFMGVSTCPFLGMLDSKLPMTAGFISNLLGAFVLYWFIGSAFVLWLAHRPNLGRFVESGISTSALDSANQEYREPTEAK